jgi:hypothetical protein
MTASSQHGFLLEPLENSADQLIYSKRKERLAKTEDLLISWYLTTFNGVQDH